jgi:hypothetical protein
MAARSSLPRSATACVSGKVGGALEQAAAAVAAEAEHPAGAGGEGELRQPGEVLGRADQHARLGVAEEIAQLVALVGGVERQVDMAGAQHRQVEEKRLDRLLGLDGDPRAGRQVERIEQVGEHRRGALDVTPGVAKRHLGDGLDRGGVEIVGEAGAEDREEIGVARRRCSHRAFSHRAWRPSSSRPRPSA